MKDQIERQAALDALLQCRKHCIDPFDSYHIDIEDAEARIRRVPAAQPERWIPVSEKLPEVREWVLCQCRAGIMDVLRLTEDGNWNKNYPHAEYMSGFVIAWMPLPEPYYGDAERRTNE